jgi:hypothetical protein
MAAPQVCRSALNQIVLLTVRPLFHAYAAARGREIVYDPPLSLRTVCADAARDWKLKKEICV